MLIMVMTVVGALVTSWFGIALCPENDQRTGFFSAGFTLVLQGALWRIYSEYWEKEPFMFFIPVLLLQVHTFMYVRFSTDMRAAFPSLRKIHAGIPAMTFAGVFAVMMWVFMAAIVNRSHF